MELTPVPTRPSLIGRMWLFVVLAVLVPLVALVVLPTAMGLHRYVVTSDAMGRSVPRGSLTFAEEVSGSQLRIGDVVTFRPPGRGEDASYVTRRVVSVSRTSIRTAGDNTGPDPWTLSSKDRPSRVVLHVPYVGYPFISGIRPSMWVLLASVPMLAVVLALVADLGRARQRRVVRRRERQRVVGS